MTTPRPRIPPLDEFDEEQRELLAKTFRGPDGELLNVFTTLARAPRLLQQVNALGGYFMAHGSLSVRDREIVILRTAAHVRCEYEMGQHRWLGARAGLTLDEIEAALDPGSRYEWSVDDQVLLAFTDELIATDTLSEEGWAALAGRFDEVQRLELLGLVGFYRMLAGILNGLAIELDGSLTKLLRDEAF